MKCCSKPIRHWSPLLAIGAGALTLTGWVQTPSGSQDPDPNTDLVQRIERIETYLQTQAKSVRATNRALNQAVEEGFTAGINFRSRETLIQAWKAQNQAALKGVPGSKAGKDQTLEK
ncbi:hypothetical protein CMO84_08990 [Candidatus Woesearchaeota archaeon]|jgi:hypothetical protein|nr:hypothetical protein [Candidatus Woesearchaeota archaeon]MDP6938612.1 hypothetical protein [Planctomycetota bacterium]